MKIAFPTQEDLGIESKVHGHFGSANFFVIVDTEADDIEVIVNHDLNHTHGKCQPMSALGGKKVHAVVVGGIGGGALKKLAEAGATTYRAVEGTVSENLLLKKSDKLPEFTMEQTCSHQHGIGDCSH